MNTQPYYPQKLREGRCLRAGETIGESSCLKLRPLIVCSNALLVLGTVFLAVFSRALVIQIYVHLHVPAANEAAKSENQATTTAQYI
jgi:hypothetical protein